MNNATLVYQQLDAIRNLPTLPAVIQKLGKAIRDPSSDAKRIAQIIEDDPAIMSRVLKIANSALYAGTSQIVSVQMAVARLGVSALNNIALSTAVFSSFGKSEGKDFDRNEFWKHSICSGIAAAVIYEKAKPNLKKKYPKDVLHLVGLLHDIGKIVFDEYFHADFTTALATSRQDQISLLDAEKKVMGIDHADAGTWLGIKWNLAEDLLQVIKHHHDPEAAEESRRECAALVHTANYICNIEKIGAGGDASPVFLPGVWKKLGLAVSDISDIVDKVKEESKKSEILMALT